MADTGMARGLRGCLAFLLLVSIAALAGTHPDDDPPPEWAYWEEQPLKEPLPEFGLTVPGSKLTLTREARDKARAAPDWFPDEHPAMPVAVGEGRAPRQLGCSLCHLPNGIGFPDSANLAGLPAAYIAEQIEEFKSGRRECAGQKETPCHKDMKNLAERLSPADVQEAASYYASLPHHSTVRVVEAAMVPGFEVFGYELAAKKDGSMEPIGQRLLELPDNPMDTYLADWHATTTAYVPPGSLARGQELVEGGDGRTACTTCHGPELQGAGNIPPLAGQRPSYLYRQLYDMQYGYRRGPAVALMLPQVAKLTADDRIAIAAYLASLKRGEK